MAHTIQQTPNTKLTHFFDLPAELSIAIYEIYAEDADKKTVCFARDRFLPPPLALVSKQVRGGFLLCWNRIDPLCEETRHIRLGVFDLDYKPACAFWERALAFAKRQKQLFDSVCITVVATRTWRRAELRVLAEEYTTWVRRNGYLICPLDKHCWEILHQGRMPLGSLVYYGMNVVRRAMRKGFTWPRIGDIWDCAREGVSVIKHRRLRGSRAAQ